MFTVNYSWNNAVDKYLSPVSGRITTIVFPLFSGRLAAFDAAAMAAPEEIPTSIPSSLAIFLEASNASSLLILIISS